MVMKKYSSYFKITMSVSALFFVLCLLFMTQFESFPEMSVFTGVMSFIFWYAGIMAPDEEKYKHID